jgi:hypothetical protein
MEAKLILELASLFVLITSVCHRSALETRPRLQRFMVASALAYGLTGAARKRKVLGYEDALGCHHSHVIGLTMPFMLNRYT